MIVELRQPLWMSTPYGEALALFLTDYGPESDHLWTCVQQEGEHEGELWTWHNSEVKVLPNRSMLRGSPIYTGAKATRGKAGMAVAQRAT